MTDQVSIRLSAVHDSEPYSFIKVNSLSRFLSAYQRYMVLNLPRMFLRGNRPTFLSAYQRYMVLNLPRMFLRGNRPTFLSAYQRYMVLNPTIKATSPATPTSFYPLISGTWF